MIIQKYLNIIKESQNAIVEKQCPYIRSSTTIANQLNIDTIAITNSFMDHFTFERKGLSEVICIDELMYVIEKLEATKIKEMITIAKTDGYWYEEICNLFLKYEPYNKKHRTHL